MGPAVAGRLIGRPFDIAMQLTVDLTARPDVAQQHGAELLVGDSALAFPGAPADAANGLPALRSGLAQFIQRLEALYGAQDQKINTQAIDNFEFLVRTPHMSLLEYCNEFSFLYQQAHALAGYEINSIARSHRFIRGSRQAPELVKNVMLLVNQDLRRFEDIYNHFLLMAKQVVDPKLPGGQPATRGGRYYTNHDDGDTMAWYYREQDYDYTDDDARGYYHDETRNYYQDDTPGYYQDYEDYEYYEYDDEEYGDDHDYYYQEDDYYDYDEPTHDDHHDYDQDGDYYSGDYDEETYWTRPKGKSKGKYRRPKGKGKSKRRPKGYGKTKRRFAMFGKGKPGDKGKPAGKGKGKKGKPWGKPSPGRSSGMIGCSVCGSPNHNAADCPVATQQQAAARPTTTMLTTTTPAASSNAAPAATHTLFQAASLRSAPRISTASPAITMPRYHQILDQPADTGYRSQQ